eukprot:scaffold21730_cov116-Skeletonema_dohrnii-CCMP3373.AAC.7
MSCYYSPHSDSEGARKHDNDTSQEQERKSNSDKDKPFRDDHPHPPPAAATSTSPEANTALTMSRAAKKRRTSYNCSISPSTQLHQYQYQQKSSSVQELNEECSSTFASMPNMYKEEEEASSTNKEVGKKPSQVHPQEEGDPNPINDTTMWNPYLPHRFQVFSPSPSHAQLHLSPSNHFHPPHEQHDKHENPDDNPLPLSLAVPYSPVRHQFCDESYVSSQQERPAPAAHLKKDPPPSAAAVATEEMKAYSDGGGYSVDLPPTLPNLPVKEVRTTTSSQRNSWDRKFNDLLEFKQQHGHCDVPQTYAPNPKLGVWVNKGELIQYAAKFGNCHVPTKYKENTALGRWVSTQRAEYKRFNKGGEKSSLTAEKIRRLDSIGFAWFMSL